MSYLPRLPFERILKRAGAKRVSQDAMEEIAKILEDRLMMIAEESAALAKHAGRKTIIDEDVRIAKKKV